MNYSIAIDGPAGAGKSTVAKLLAKKLKLTYIDTGAMYRALTLLAQRENAVNTEDIISLANSCNIRIENDKIYIEDEDITNEIRSDIVSKNVSKIAKIPEIRRIMLKHQRKLAKNKAVVMDGRDIGTTVLPDAKYKFYLTADLKERALRRYKEMLRKGEKTSLKQIEEDIAHRDLEDSSRVYSPLTVAPDAIVVDTTNMDIEEVVNILSNYIKGEGDNAL